MKRYLGDLYPENAVIEFSKRYLETFNAHFINHLWFKRQNSREISHNFNLIQTKNPEFCSESPLKETKILKVSAVTLK